MADFFENLGKIISEKAEVVSKKTGEVVDAVAKKTEQTVEVQKIKSQMHVMERSNERDFKDIGKMIYDRFKKGEVVDAQFIELCEAIAEREDSIEKSKREIAEIKGLDICLNCDAPLEANAKFCSKCGAKVEDEVLEEKEAVEVEAEFEEEE